MSLPGVMKVDYVRVYQRTEELSPDGLSCDPKGYPTADYIERHIEAYTNPNLTTWTKQGGLGGPAGYQWPKNSAVSASWFPYYTCCLTRFSMTDVECTTISY